MIDSNILIYAGDPRHKFLRTFLKNSDPIVSVVSYIEVVGYHELTDEQRQYFAGVFELIPIIFVDQRIAEKAVTLRQQRKMTLGDSIIAATAIVEGHTLVTRNTDDFRWISALTLLDPFKQTP